MVSVPSLFAALPVQVDGVAATVAVGLALTVMVVLPEQVEGKASVYVTVTAPVAVVLTVNTPLASMLPAVIGLMDQVPPAAPPVCVKALVVPPWQTVASPLTVIVGQTQFAGFKVTVTSMKQLFELMMRTV